MAASISAATTRNVAYQVVMGQKVRGIKTTDYTAEAMTALDKDLLAASLAVPSMLGGGKHGHSWMLFDEAGYRTYSGRTTGQTYITNPGNTPSIAIGDSAAVVSQKTAELVGLLDSYYTQEGVKAGLRDLILKNVPKQSIQDLEDRDHGFTKITLLALLQHLRSNAEAVDYLSITEKLAQRNAPIDFEGDESLKSFFARIDRLIKELRDDSVATSHSKLIVLYLGQLEGQGGPELREALSKWYALTEAQKTWGRFKTTFADADRLRRQALKAGSNASSANAGGVHIHSANNVRNVGGNDGILQSGGGDGVSRQEILQMFSQGLQVFADEAQHSINEAIEQKFKGLTTSGATMAVHKDGKGTSGGSVRTNEAALMRQVEDLKRQIKALAKKATKNDGTKNNGVPAVEAKQCPHCPGKHKPNKDGVVKCWKTVHCHLAPEWWLKRYGHKKE
jgi:hypothetical protein